MTKTDLEIETKHAVLVGLCTIISRNWVLTTATIFKAIDILRPEILKVRMGAMTKGTESTEINVLSIQKHPQNSELINDLALVQVGDIDATRFTITSISKNTIPKNVVVELSKI